MREVLLDTNVFILLLIGQIKPENISGHKRTSVYNKDHFDYLLGLISNFDHILISPNVATEVDNLLNNFTGDEKYMYLSLTRHIFKTSIEKYIQTSQVVEQWHYDTLGVTDSAILMMAQNCDLLISGDSELCDYAKSFGIEVFDFKEYVNFSTYQ